MSNDKIISPCINTCKLDEAKDICIGCGRTSKEITHWLFYTDKQQLRITKESQKRLREYLNADSKRTSQ